MSKNLKDLLAKLGVEDQDAIYAALTSDVDNTDAVTIVLKKAQDYSKPFLETEFNTKLDTERKTWKGKYFQDAARQANKMFGNKLTNKELEDVMNDPANEGTTFQAVLEAVKEKVMDKTGSSEAQMQQMLDAANGKIADAEKALADAEARHKKDFEDYKRTGKMTAKLENELISYLTTKTTMNAAKAAELLKDKLMQRALIEINDKNELELFDPSSTAENKIILKKDETTRQTLTGLIDQLADEYELPKIESGGVKKIGASDYTPPKVDISEELYKNSAVGASEALGTALLNQ